MLSYSVIDAAREEMAKDFRLLPDHYFADKNSRTFRFNNIQRLYSRRPQTNSANEIRDNLAALLDQPTLSFYAGVPWCEQICHFCDLAFGVTTKNDRDKRQRYLETLEMELELLKKHGAAGKVVKSIYFGGGTPTVLDDDQFAFLLRSIINGIKPSPGSSITCEAAPSSLTSEKIAIMQDAGVTRLSSGLQTIDDSIRSAQHQLLSGQEAMRAIEASLGKFDVVNTDLIYGFPNETLDSWARTVNEVSSMGIPSITLYRLEVRDRTANLRRFEKDSERFPEEFDSRLRYYIAKNILSDKGYVESPLGWWIKAESTKPSWELHKQIWRNVTPYIGIGQGAWSQGPSFYYINSKLTKEWEEMVRTGEFPVKSYTRLREKDAFIFQFIRELRTYGGINLEVSKDTATQLGLGNQVDKFVQQQCDWGLLSEESQGFSLTAAGKALVHWIIDDFIDACA
ncbi:oxygen-independent coproporphyrinogen III oxidase family protein [Sulfobacillus acidophilus TPY]|uniref:Heme chaperone HemW n=1 Tax=Sulfobacillus acidophilus (strain ATCC 700253 / DSM 10332 / NAL) TaxID=679936 RepID=G8TZY7_SULAD|nr:oxygen-independent coproporphyrinogen III oxidase family protein [Sulfobacillus acidophilus TPY]AEW04156.1 Radical SAM domain protein [Sulfobacillus acidophilus DSM 10332]